MTRRKDIILARIRRKLADGFWYPPFQDALEWAYDNLSIGHRFVRIFSLYGYEPLGASELWQFIVVLCGAIWLTLVHRPLHHVLSAPPLQWIGIIVAAALMADLLLFSLHWTFVANKPLESVRRSLATSLLSLIEVAIYFSIFLSLSDCLSVPRPASGIFYDQMAAILKVRLPSVSPSCFCQTVAHFELIVGGSILVIIVASLVGEVVRRGRTA